jgi:hypothetical protein
MKKSIWTTLLLATAALCLELLAVYMTPATSQAWPPASNMLLKDGFAMTTAITRNPNAMIQYTLPYPCQVTMVMYDMQGRAVQTLVNAEKGAGDHYVEFAGFGHAAGIYFYRMQAGPFTGVGRLILLK